MTAQFYQFLSNPGPIEKKKRQTQNEKKKFVKKSPNQVNKNLFDHSCLVQCVYSQLFAVANT